MAKIGLLKGSGKRLKVMEKSVKSQGILKWILSGNPEMAFNIGFYAYAIIGHTRADQLLPQLLMEQFDTFPIQCRHIEHMHEGVWFRKNNF